GRGRALPRRRVADPGPFARRRRLRRQRRGRLHRRHAVPRRGGRRRLRPGQAFRDGGPDEAAAGDARGAAPQGTEPCRVDGEAATVVVWSPDYDGKGKALVRFEDGREAIVGGSRV